MRLRAGLTLALSLLLLAPAGASARPLPARARHKLARIVRADMRAGLIPGVTIGLWDPRKGTWVRSFGVANRRTGRRLRPTDHQRIGSITKTFTATVVLQLVQEHRLRLSQPIRRWAPEFPNAGRITVRMLLNHTSGLFDPTNGDPAFAARIFAHPFRPFPVRTVLRAAAAHAPYFAPGAGWHYSNTNYLLLGRIIRRVTGHGPAAEIRRRLLGPLHLRSTAFSPARIPAPRTAGYLVHDALTVPTTKFNVGFLGAAGALTSDVYDVGRWAPVLATGRGVLSRRLQRQRLRGMVPMGIPGARYGLGIFRLGPWLGHDGEVAGYAAIVLYEPRLHASLVVLETTSPDDDLLPPGHTPQSTATVASDIVGALYPGGVPDSTISPG